MYKYTHILAIAKLFFFYNAISAYNAFSALKGAEAQTVSNGSNDCYMLDAPITPAAITFFEASKVMSVCIFQSCHS